MISNVIITLLVVFVSTYCGMYYYVPYYGPKTVSFVKVAWMVRPCTYNKSTTNFFAVSGESETMRAVYMHNVVGKCHLMHPTNISFIH